MLGDLPSGLFDRCCVLYEQPRGLDARGHVRDLERYCLMLSDGLAELDTRRGVCDGCLETSLRDAHGQRCDAYAPAVKGVHADLEPHPLAADDVLLRDVDILEHHLHAIVRALAHLVLVLGDRDPLRIALDQERGQTLVSERWIQGRDAVNDAGVRARGKEDLRAGDDIPIPLPSRTSRYGTGIAPGVRLALREADDLPPARDVPEIFLLQLLAPVPVQGIASEGVRDRKHDADRSAAARYLLAKHRIGHEIKLCPSPLLRCEGSEITPPTHLIDHSFWECLLPIPILSMGDHLLLDEIAHLLPELLLLGGEGEHRGSIPSIG